MLGHPYTNMSAWIGKCYTVVGHKKCRVPDGNRGLSFEAAIPCVTAMVPFLIENSGLAKISAAVLA